VSSFLAQAAAAFSLLDDAFGDPLTITPQVAGEFLANGPDSGKPAFVAIGILDLVTLVDTGSGHRDGMRTEVVAEVPVADFAFTQFGPGRPLPVQGTRITAPPNTLRAPTNGFQVVDRLPDGDDGRVRFQLVAL
jgi:hypothetical protein